MNVRGELSYLAGLRSKLEEAQCSTERVLQRAFGGARHVRWAYVA